MGIGGIEEVIDVSEHKATPEELRRLLLVRLENYKSSMNACGSGNRWYFVARIHDLVTELARLNDATDAQAAAGSVTDPRAA